GVFDVLVLERERATVLERLPAPPTANDRSRMDLRLEALADIAPGRDVTGLFLAAGFPPEPVRRRHGASG
ncbi:MAG TPA: hypothetical protein VJ921_10585, partial [Vicinamibacteria bacterium]|nr:hypothetical protein [Vicinamibacteria bacterium]